MQEFVRNTVQHHIPINEAEQQSIAAFLTEFDRLRYPFSEHADPVHVTGSAILIGPRGVLLLKHKRLGRWLQPGGHIDQGETPWQAAFRETVEETGLDVAFAEIDDTGKPPLAHVDVHEAARGHTHLDLRYVLTSGEADPTPPPGESQEIGWFNWEDAVTRTDDGRLSDLLVHLGSRHTGK